MTSISVHPLTVLIVDDQKIICETIRNLLKEENDIHVHSCTDPSQAIDFAKKVHPTVILLDLVMPDVDGLTLMRYMRTIPEIQDVPIIVLSSKEDPITKSKAFERGTNDYLVKLPSKSELIARLRYHSNAYIRLLERNKAYDRLYESESHLKTELAQAAQYVEKMIPEAFHQKTIKLDWTFVPSEQLGGDGLGYRWIDDERIALYLFDVCGHGVGAALLSISIFHLLNLPTIPINLSQPSQVLQYLNETFPMEKQNYNFFTIWYGVYNRTTRDLIYSTGGHPPPILFKENGYFELKAEGPVIGGCYQDGFKNYTTKIDKDCRLLIYSDGAYEIQRADGNYINFNEFIEIIRKTSFDGLNPTRSIFNQLKSYTNKEYFDDDFSIILIQF